MWVLEYLKEIESDFVAIYHIIDYDEMESRKWLRLARHLPYYEGALRKRLQMENEEERGGEKYLDEHGEKRSMTMKEALTKAKEGSDENMDTLDALNQEGENSAFGALFERSTVSAE